VESWRVITESRADGEAVSESTVKLVAGGEREIVTGEGNGPVNALDHALRTAIERAYPVVNKFELVDYKVRILDSHHGTDAVTRVLLDSADGQESWGSIGVSENIIEASWQALVDSLEYAFQQSRATSSASPAAVRGSVTG
jgi:2-isopropylmalate synthase